MTTKTDKLKLAESLIAPIAQPHVPEGTQVEAVIDQWIHAIATGSEFFCNSNIEKSSVLKDRVTTLLNQHNINTEKDHFFNLVFNQQALKPHKNACFRFIDLFAGIGGVRLGFQQAGGTCVFSSEFDRYAQLTYKKNHGETPFGDITLIPPESIPEHDILLAGFPCQPFSHAGLKLGIADTRGTLFHDIATIIKTKQPRYALLENVKGLISHDKGHTLKVILKTLTSIGYSCNIPKDIIEKGSTKEIQTLAKKMVLKSVDFGIPQNRQRIYIVLWKDGEIERFEYPKPTGLLTKVGDVLEADPDCKLTISDRLWAGHKRRKAENAKNGKGFGYGIFSEESPYTNTISARYYKDGSEALIQQNGKNPRKISTREAARLQGFPDSFLPSDSSVQAYKQFGNSVTVNVITALAKQLIKNTL